MEIQTKIKGEFDWHNYNISQTKEKILFVNLLKELCGIIKEQQHCRGRKPATLRHKIFCMCMKTYENTSSRRIISELDMCKKAHYLYKLPHFNSIINYFNDPDLTLLLKELIEISAMPLASIEKRFAVDSTGFSLRILSNRWSVAKMEPRNYHKYMKAHVLYGTYSNIATACEVTDGTSNDSPQFKPLLQEASKHFAIEEVSADLAYSSRENVKAVFDAGGFPLIPFKKSAVGNARGTMLWSQLFKYFKESNKEFMFRYHLRSNAESGFWMIKQRFGEFVKSRNFIGQTNEILCKVLSHNLCVLAQELFLSGIEIDFNEEFKNYSAQELSSFAQKEE
jgi:transposase